MATLAPLRQRTKFRRLLLNWYVQNRRDLPWRRTSDPYRIWISEIMLQQTRVAAVLEHYRDFMTRFPDVASLAAAKEEEVLAAWSGLGYYRRARNMHLAAKKIVAEFDGKLPSDEAQIRSLPGIGRYTSAAISSIAFGAATAVVDGNVERVLARLTRDPKIVQNSLWALANDLLCSVSPGDFNQAMMELGATICLPREPRCKECPVRLLCSTRGPLSSEEKPAKTQKADIAFLLAQNNGKVFLTKRAADSNLMPGMWELPERKQKNKKSENALLRHSILNTEYRVWVDQGSPSIHQAGDWHDSQALSALPLTGLARKILLHFGLIAKKTANIAAG